MKPSTNPPAATIREAGPPERFAGSTGGWGPPSSPPNQEFRGWTIVEPFPARGGEADVFLVEKAGERRVLKLYRYGIVPRDEVFVRLLALSNQAPEGLVRLFEYGTDEPSGCFFEFSEFIPHGSLADLNGSQRYPPDRLKSIVSQVARALETLHQNTILHLDVKPANLLVRDPIAPVVALADFGISSVFDAAHSKKLTLTKGTSLYQSPESIAGAIAPTSDWWALGILVLELLQGRHPFDGLQRQVVLYQLTTQGVPIPPDLEPGWRNLLMGLLTRNPEKRWKGPEVFAWLAGKTLPTSYQEERPASPATGTAPGSDVPTAYAVPFSLTSPAFPARRFVSPAELFAAAFADPSAWDAVRTALGRGEIAEWAAQNGDLEKEKLLRETVEAEGSLPLAVFKCGLFIAPDLPFAWDGRRLTEEVLVELLERYTARRVSTDEQGFLERIIDGELFVVYARLTGRHPEGLGMSLRVIQAMKNSALAKETLARRAELVVLAVHGAFGVARALPTLLESCGGTSTMEALESWVTGPAFREVALKAGIWSGNDADVWATIGACWENHKKQPGQVGVPAGFVATPAMGADLKRHAPLREYLVRLFAVPAVDQRFIRQTLEVTAGAGWVEPLIRSIFQFPENRPLPHCLRCRYVAAAIEARWNPELKYRLAPPYLVALFEKQVIRPEELKTVETVLEDAEILVEKSVDLPDFAALETLAGTRLTAAPDSIEYLHQLRAAFQWGQNRKTLGDVASTAYRLLDGVAHLALLLFCLFVGLIIYDGMTTMRRGRNRPQAREKACYANMRVIQGAIEMYNMDHSAQIKTTLPLENLVSTGYMKSVPVCSERTGVYDIAGDISVEGKIRCSIHETVD